MVLLKLRGRRMYQKRLRGRLFPIGESIVSEAVVGFT